MSVQLPISIKLNDELKCQFVKLKSITNKLEAQFNFQTMTAGWYGDEENIVDICLSVETPISFNEQTDTPSMNERIDYADDAVSFFDKDNNILHCFVALTESELILLDEHTKLLAGFVEKKLCKVLNLIAERLSFSPI
jgi:hypothetical protein